MDSKHRALPITKIGVGNCAQSSRILFRCRDDLVSKLILLVVYYCRRLIARKQTRVVRENIGTSVSDEIIDILAVDFFV